jgi:hypothetical protein
VLNDKWDPQNPDCVFQHYFYNAVKPEEAPFYGPAPGEDERKWEEALSKKPAPGAIPVLARGFEQVAERIRQQQMAVTALRTRLHEINNSLSVMKDTHELNVASRITEAKRKHIVFAQRTLALATKVQILRHRGYVMDQQEEDLKKKLVELEKKTFDPVLGGRQEEIWARMSGVRERARILQEETEKLGKAVDGQKNGELLSEEDQKALERVSRRRRYRVLSLLTPAPAPQGLRQAARAPQEVGRRHKRGVRRVRQSKGAEVCQAVKSRRWSVAMYESPAVGGYLLVRGWAGGYHGVVLVGRSIEEPTKCTRAELPSSHRIVTCLSSSRCCNLLESDSQHRLSHALIISYHTSAARVILIHHPHPPLLLISLSDV